MTLWLARHAQPLIASGTCYGQLDVSDDPIATQQAAQQLAAVLPASITVTSSPLQRCEHLAQAVCGLRPDLTYKTDDRLEEMNFGQWEGLTWANISPDALQAWTNDFPRHTVGINGETVQAFMQRVALVFDELVQARQQDDTLWITHAGVIRAATLLASGVRELHRASEWPAQAPAYGQWCTLEI